jgi:hypothetical protein
VLLITEQCSDVQCSACGRMRKGHKEWSGAIEYIRMAVQCSAVQCSAVKYSIISMVAQCNNTVVQCSSTLVQYSSKVAQCSITVVQ